MPKLAPLGVVEVRKWHRLTEAAIEGDLPLEAPTTTHFICQTGGMDQLWEFWMWPVGPMATMSCGRREIPYEALYHIGERDEYWQLAFRKDAEFDGWSTLHEVTWQISYAEARRKEKASERRDGDGDD